MKYQQHHSSKINRCGRAPGRWVHCTAQVTPTGATRRCAAAPTLPCPPSAQLQPRQPRPRPGDKRRG